MKGAQAELDKVMAQLKEKQEKLAAIEAKVNIGIAYHMPKQHCGINWAKPLQLALFPGLPHFQF